MESFSFNLQAEKANAIINHRKLRRIASLLRLVEVCVVLVLVSRLSLKLPAAVKNSSEYLKDLSLFMNSPRFVFLIGNVIIITLFAQYGHFSAQGSGRNVVPELDIYHELAQNSTTHAEKQRIRTDDDGGIENRRINRDMENDGIVASMKNQRDYEGRTKGPEEQRIMKAGEANIGLRKGYRRCETEILKKRRRVLRRCESESRKKRIEAAPPAADEMAKISYPEDDMSNEEFRRTVEAFIARQQRIRREEHCSLV